MLYIPSLPDIDLFLFLLCPFLSDRSSFGWYLLKIPYLLSSSRYRPDSIWERSTLNNEIYEILTIYLTNFAKIALADFNPLLDKYSFWRIINRQLLKTLWEKKKLHVTSNFFFSHNVFYSVRKLYPHLSIFWHHLLFADEVEEPKIGISGKGISDFEKKNHHFQVFRQTFHFFFTGV